MALNHSGKGMVGFSGYKSILSMTIGSQQEPMSLLLLLPMDVTVSKLLMTIQCNSTLRPAEVVFIALLKPHTSTQRTLAAKAT